MVDAETPWAPLAPESPAVPMAVYSGHIKSVQAVIVLGIDLRPFCEQLLHHVMRPSAEAKYNVVAPSFLLAFTSAPLAISSRTTSG